LGLNHKTYRLRPDTAVLELDSVCIGHKIALKGSVVGSVRLNRNDPTRREARKEVNTREADIRTSIDDQINVPQVHQARVLLSRKDLHEDVNVTGISPDPNRMSYTTR
jgi:hypothetical protein